MKKLYKEVEIRDISDLVYVVDCNAESLARQIRKITKNQRSLTILSISVIGLAITAAYQRKKLEEQIYNLSIRVKNLENNEEE